MNGHDERSRSPFSGAFKHAPAPAHSGPWEPFTNTQPDTNPNGGLNAHPADEPYDGLSLTQNWQQQQAQWLDFQDPQQQQHQQQDQYLGKLQGPSVSSQTDSSAFPSFDFNQANFDQNASLDPSLLANFDSNGIDLPSGADQSAGTLDPMATIQSHSHSPTPPHLRPEMAGRRQSQSPSPHASPSFQQTTFGVLGRPRNTSESLDPSSAMFPQGQQNEWSGMRAYRGGHNRTPSDQFSDISSLSHSNKASPYLTNLDSFDAHSSPMLNPSQDPVFNNDLGLQGFTLGDNQIPQQAQTQQSFYSPGHSPQPSPRLIPQQLLPPFTATDNYGLNGSVDGHYGQVGQQSNGLEMFPSINHEAFPALNHQSPNEFGQADQFTPPEINIDFAPPSRIETMRPGNAEDALRPPMRTLSRNRMRAKSDSYAAGSRPSTSSIPARERSPSLQPSVSDTAADSLSPFPAPSTSRSPSPARGRATSLSTRDRASSTASDHHSRDRILELALPERSPSASGLGGLHNGGNLADPTGSSKRLQKHPATFQCTLCPKRFTRAYNLRSHLRTHTDERPFVCTVCCKAFARQHDRKRHEGLHSGEKKFVCRGTLMGMGGSAENGGTGPQWGCGRKFARADALGRHFRSEAGRVCIKPLLDEEAAERQRGWMLEQQQQQHQQQQQAQAHFTSAPPSLLFPSNTSGPPHFPLEASFLPAALLQQYPALAGIDWSTVPQGPPPNEEDYSGRSSFEMDASSGGEYYDDLSEGEMGGYAGDPALMGLGLDQGGGGGMGGQVVSGGLQHQHSHQQLQQQQQGGFAASGFPTVQAGDYLEGFEGR